MQPYVITISRQFASMGRTIAQKMAQELDINFYDRDIVEETAKRMGLPVSTISGKEENVESKYFKRMYPLGMGMSSMQDEIFQIQKNIIRDLAEKENCIIVGRCADSILLDRERHLNVYVYASEEERLKNCVTNLGMDEKTAKKMIREVDRSRLLYHRRYCPEAKDMLDDKDIMIDSGRFGVEATVRILTGIVREIFYNAP